MTEDSRAEDRRTILEPSGLFLIGVWRRQPFTVTLDGFRLSVGLLGTASGLGVKGVRSTVIL